MNSSQIPVKSTLETTIMSMDEQQWRQISEMFDRLLEGEPIESVLDSEGNPAVREETRRLWKNHNEATAADYLEAPLEFQIAPLLQSGQVLLGRFRIERLLGAGGMGEVYLAWDRKMEIHVAIKTVARLLAHSERVRRRFVAEVQNARRVTHPNVCRIHELFEEEYIAFFSMEFVEGVPLSSFDTTKVPEAHLLSLVIQLAEGLHAAHLTDVVHGDFKPGNVMIVSARGEGEPPRAVIMDFGLARAAGNVASLGDETLSLRGGSADYMAPELLKGAPPTVRSDIFAFGKVAATLLPNRKLWQRCSEEEVENRPASLAGVLAQLRTGTSRRKIIVGGAIAAFTTAGAAELWLRSGNASSDHLPPGSRILVNGFRSEGSGAGTARLVRSLVLTSLLQSSRIRAISDQDLISVLGRIKPGATPPVGAELLSELVTRVRAAFLLEGELRQYSGRFSLELRLMAASSAIPVASAALRDLPSIAAIAKAAALWLRRKAGESPEAIAANPADVASYTSRVPEALQSYFDGMERYSMGRMDAAVPFFREAVRLDPAFAQAHNMLGLTVNAARQSKEAFTEIELARNLSSKLPELEKGVIENTYFRLTEDPVNSVATGLRAVSRQPDEPRIHAILGRSYLSAGMADNAVDSFRKAVELGSDNWQAILALQDALTEAGRYRESLQEFERARSRGVTNEWLFNGAGAALLGLEQYEDAGSAFKSEPKAPENTANLQNISILQGHFELAIAAMTETQSEAQGPAEAFQANEYLCGLYFLTGRQELGLPYLREMAALPAFPPFARHLSSAASWARRFGDGETLAAVAKICKSISVGWPNRHTESVSTHCDALLLWHRKQFPAASEILLKASGLSFNLWAIFDLADLFTRLGQWELAENYWQKFEERQGTIFVKGWFPGLNPVGWLSRAAAASARNNTETASRYSHRVLRHWQAAQPNLAFVKDAEVITRFAKPATH